ncbi:uncharacterized protein METZ01_LOCUS227914, partial [marine metagenome]
MMFRFVFCIGLFVISCAAIAQNSSTDSIPELTGLKA